MRATQFINEYEKGTANSRQIFAKLEQLGYERLGTGQDATVWTNNKNHVIKILMPADKRDRAESSFLTFYEFCQEHPQNPFLPKFIDIDGAHHTQFMINNVPYRQVAMERLRPFKSGSFEEQLVWILSDFAGKAPWAKVVTLLKQPKTWEWYPHEGSEAAHKAIANRISKKLTDPALYKYYGTLFITMSRLYNTGLGKGLRWDLHTENAMQRKDGTIVITDPFYS